MKTSRITIKMKKKKRKSSFHRYGHAYFIIVPLEKSVVIRTAYIYIPELIELINSTMFFVEKSPGKSHERLQPNACGK
uniref:Uncharacterized protein n=1 Tax=Daphnia magna TaxID=35525 RepID=A0A0P6IFG2_9CRUS